MQFSNGPHPYTIGKMISRHMVIGGAGFIGSHLIDGILGLEPQSEILVIDNLSVGDTRSARSTNSSRVGLSTLDARDPRGLLANLEAFRPNKIWHLAANSDISKSGVSSDFDVEATFATTAAICLAISKLPQAIDALIFSSTSAIFGSQSNKIREDSPRNPESAYGWMKLASERLIQATFSAGAIGSVLSARFPNVTGERQTHGVVKDLVFKYFDFESDWVILGDGYQEKPYIHVIELVNVLLARESSLKTGDYIELNISPETTSTVRSIVSEIERQANRTRIPLFGDTSFGWPGDIPKYEFDTSKLRSLGHVITQSDDAITLSVREEIKKYCD